MREISDLYTLETPPTEAGTRGVPVAIPAADTDWPSLLPTGFQPSGPCYVTIINPTAGAILYGFASSAGAATAVNGFPVAAGQTKRFLVYPTRKHQRICASAVGSFLYVSSMSAAMTNP